AASSFKKPARSFVVLSYSLLAVCCSLFLLRNRQTLSSAFSNRDEPFQVRAPSVAWRSAQSSATGSGISLAGPPDSSDHSSPSTVLILTGTGSGPTGLLPITWQSSAGEVTNSSRQAAGRSS